MSEVIYYELNDVEAKIYRYVESHGRPKRQFVVNALAHKEVYGSCHDFMNADLHHLYLAARKKYERNFKSLVKGKLIKCVNRRMSTYSVAE